jgi:hypothetical protein
MSALQRLKDRLNYQQSRENIVFPANEGISKTIEVLKAIVGKAGITELNRDIQLESLKIFSRDKKLTNYKAARLICFGLCVPYDDTRVPIIEDNDLFFKVFDNNFGIGQWREAPVLYRRCYQGLIISYFSYDGVSKECPETGQANWMKLREYLNGNVKNIIHNKYNPEWVSLLNQEPKLLSINPCDAYAQQLLDGKNESVDFVIETLGISDSSWFVRELIISQIKYTTGLIDVDFKRYIPTAIMLIENNFILRDQCLTLMLNRYSSCNEIEINEIIRNASVDWWGNPWLPSNETRWGSVIPEARKMIADWLKSEFVEAFFTKLAQDGVGDRRRANFWLKYVKSMDNIQFALGSHALRSADKDFAELRKKMKGLYTALDDSDENNNAFVMTMGKLVVVEFGSSGNAVYAYNSENKLPFDMSRPVAVKVDYPNSLKNSRNFTKMLHMDGSRNGDKWEDKFSNKLFREYNIYQNSKTTFSKKTGKDGAASDKFSLFELNKFAKLNRLKVEDFNSGGKGGNIWVRTSDEDPDISKVLKSWNFNYKPGKGWWR